MNIDISALEGKKVSKATLVDKDDGTGLRLYIRAGNILLSVALSQPEYYNGCLADWDNDTAFDFSSEDAGHK